jgi:hypothetical protein
VPGADRSPGAHPRGAQQVEASRNPQHDVQAAGDGRSVTADSRKPANTSRTIYEVELGVGGKVPAHLRN